MESPVRYRGTWRSWFACIVAGTDGIDDLGIIVNEVLAHTDMPLTDSIELHNTTAVDVDLSG